MCLGPPGVPENLKTSKVLYRLLLTIGQSSVRMQNCFYPSILKEDTAQVALTVGPSLANCGNRWQMVGWHASNEPTQAQQL